MKRVNLDYTFEITPGAGLADKLGVQFAYLYTLGVKCGWRYRLVEPVSFDRAQIFYSRRKRLLTRLASNFGLRNTRWYINRYTGQPIADFLGFGSPDAKLSDYENIVDINLNELLQDAKDLNDVKEKVQRFLSYSSNPETLPCTLVRIKKDQTFYALRDRISTLLECSASDIIDFAGGRYLRMKLDTNWPGLVSSACTRNKLTLVHLRLGDSICLSTDKGVVILHGKVCYFSFEEYYQKVKPIDPERFPWFDPYKLSFRIERELQSRGISADSLFVISDGFKSSREALNRAAKAHSEKLSPVFIRSAHQKINELERQFKQAFAWVSADHFVIGEGNRQTIQSIDLISKADLILCNSGGFSAFLGRIYGHPDQKPTFQWIGRDIL